MKKIAIVTTTIYPDLGGGELYMLNLAKEFVKNGYMVDVICISNEIDRIISKEEFGITFHYVKQSSLGGYPFPSFFSVIKILKKINPDIIYTSGPGVHDFFVVFYNLFARKKLIMTYHAMHDQGRFILRIFTNIYFLFVIPFYKSIIVTTQKYYDILDKRKVKNLHFIPCGVEKKKLNIDIIGKKEKKEKLLFVGVLDDAHRYKNLSTLIEAMKFLPDFELSVIGDGDTRKDFEKQAENIKNIKFLGAIRGLDLKKYYEEANIFILPSNSSQEGFGIVLLEAIGNGCKIITGEKCGGSFLIRENKFLGKLYNGDSVDLAYKIKDVYSENNSDKAIIENFLQGYYWENISKNIIKTI